MNIYDILTKRNIDYVPSELQNKIRETRILIAGCGIGSSFAEAAVRIGFENLILADGDVVSDHNLNRQFYSVKDIGELKVAALSERLREINPEVKITEFRDYISKENVATMVGEADIVFDTIDFLDLSAIVSLHDECKKQKKHIISALAVGWGSGCIYFPPDSQCTFRQLFSLPAEGSVSQIGYGDAFSKVMQPLSKVLDPGVVYAVGKALTIMEDGKPCPASQVSPGAFAVGALATTLVVRILADLPVLTAPNLILMDMQKLITNSSINLMS